MSEQDEIKERVEFFRKMQERLCAERDARMNRTTQQTRKTVSEIFTQTMNLSARLTSHR